MTHELLRARLKACALALLCAILSTTLCLPAGSAQAEVLKSDIVYGSTVESMGLTVAQCPDIESSYAIVIDSDGNVIFERDADTQTQIASITKVMTAIVALENGTPTDTITVSSYAAQIGESSAGLQAGDEMDLSTAIRAMMVPSGNDAAEALCEYYGRQMLLKAGAADPTREASIAAFVQAMNETAARIGMTNSVFSNPHGLDDGEYAGDLHSTARDVGKMCVYAMQIQEFRDAVDNEQVTLTVTRDGSPTTITLTSTDELFGVLEGICGIKTGYTDSAGACFAGCVNRDGRDLYTVVLHAPDELTRFTDTETLVEWYYEHEVSYPIVNTTVYESGTTPLIARVADTDYVDRTVAATFADNAMTLDVFDLHGNVSQKLVATGVSGTIHAGDVVGQVIFMQHNEEVGRADLVAIYDVQPPDFLTSITTAVDRFFRGIRGEATVAESSLVNESKLINDKSSTS